MKEYKIMMMINGKWWNAHVNCRMAKITKTHKDAVVEMERVKESRLKWKHPAEAYKIVCRNVTEWEDV